MAGSGLEHTAGIPAEDGQALQGRALLGWMTRDEAVRFLTNDCLFPTPLTEQQAQELWQARKEIVDALPHGEAVASETIPLWDADQKVIRQFRSRHPEADSIVDFARLNPLDLVVHQLWISTEIAAGFSHRVTPEKWVHTSLIDPPASSRPGWRREGNALLVDLPHFEFFLAGPRADGEMWIAEAEPFVTVALHAGRGLLLRGYHRTAALGMSLHESGASSGSALFGVSNALELMGSDADEIHRMMEKPRPPRLGDFFDERLSLPVMLRRRQYRMRIEYDVAEVAPEGLPRVAEPLPYAEALEREARRRSAESAKPAVPIANVRGMFDAAMRYGKAGQYDRAARIYEQIVALKPDFADAWNNLAVALIKMEKYAEAVTHVERALALRPNDAEFHFTIGIALGQSGRYAEAAEHYLQTLELDPDKQTARMNLSAVYFELGKLDQAIEQGEVAVAREPANPDLLSNLAAFLMRARRLGESKAYCERALAIDFRIAKAHYLLGAIAKFNGEMDEARAHFAKTLEIEPDHAQTHVLLADLKKFRSGDPELAAMEQMLLRTNDVTGQEQLHFALAKAYEDCKEYSQSFEHLRKGNALKRAHIPYEHERAIALTRRITALFDRSFLEQFEAAGDPSTVPIFVLGMPRSGSTLVEQILGSHPAISAAGELADLSKAEHSVLESIDLAYKFPEHVPMLQPATLRRIGEEYVRRLQPYMKGKTRVVDKLPSNFLKIGLIRMILPNAKIIHTMRDPVDTCVSCFSRSFEVGGPAYTYDMTELGQYYRCYAEVMAHWRSVLPRDAYLDVSYEALTEDPEGQARRLIDYCGLPWDESCLNFHQNTRPVFTASVVQVRQPIYRTSVQRWRKYESEIGPLLDALGDLVSVQRGETPVQAA